MILHLGVIDLPYGYAGALAMRRARGKKPAGATSTGDVAGYLENKYHVMRNFFEIHADDVAGDLEEGIKDSLEALLSGSAAAATNPFASGLSKIEDRFKQYLSQGEMERIGYPGVPTQAALKGISHRFKRKRSGRRPSFIDTGMYQQSFKAWVD